MVITLIERQNKKMENAILEKEDKYIKDGYKQIYPNDMKQVT